VDDQTLNLMESTVEPNDANEACLKGFERERRARRRRDDGRGPGAWH
jgi:hypothetical protein